MNEKTIKQLQALPRVLIENGITYYIIPQEEYEKLKDKKQEVKKKDKIDYMKEYIKTVENARNDLERELEQKEQECEELKEAIDSLLKIQYQLADSCTKYEQTLTEIKEICNSVENIENINSLYDAKLSGMYLQANKIL